jgi:hypothetical protein
MGPGALRQLGSARSRFKRTVGVQHGVRKRRCRSCAIFRPPTERGPLRPARPSQAALRLQPEPRIHLGFGRKVPGPFSGMAPIMTEDRACLQHPPPPGPGPPGPSVAPSPDAPGRPSGMRIPPLRIAERAPVARKGDTTAAAPGGMGACACDSTRTVRWRRGGTCVPSALQVGGGR